MSGRTLRLIILGGLFVGWVGWLGWQTRDARGVTISRSQIAVATELVLADVEVGPDGLPQKQVRNVEPLGPGERLETLDLTNLANAQGFRGSGRYLLPLNKFGEIRIVSMPPRSPGVEREYRPLIYPWSDRVQRQLEQLRPGLMQNRAEPG